MVFATEFLQDMSILQRKLHRKQCNKISTGHIIYIQPLIGTGLPRVREKSGKFIFFQGQGIVRESCKLSGKFGIFGKCQGIVREFVNARFKSSY